MLSRAFYVVVLPAAQDLSGWVKTVNGESADSDGSLVLDHLTAGNTHLYLNTDGNVWIDGYRVIRNNDIILVGGVNSITVPSGGTWVVFAIYWTAAYGNSAPVMNTYAGGTVVASPDTGAHSMVAICIKIE